MTMKVRIEDKEALDALSWQALRAYLDRTGWKQSKDIPGKGVIYKHKGSDRRLREIAVPLRRDFADYAARMGDAVGTLARVEDRSELDVYVDLRALGDKLAPGAADGAESSHPVADDATRAMHERIRKWLVEEGWHVRDIDHAESSLNIMVTLKSQQEINIYQLKEHLDHLTLHIHLTFGEDDLNEISQIPEDSRREIGWDIFQEVSIMGVEIAPLNTQLSEMRFLTYIYFDGLTKDTLIQRILLVLRAASLSVHTIARGFARAGRSAEAMSNLLRLVPREHAGPGIGGGLSVAS